MSEHSKSSPAAQDFLLLHRSPAGQDFLVLLSFILLTLIVRLNAVFNLNTHVLGGSEGDPGLYLWLIKNHTQHLLTQPWFNTPAFYPYAQTLAWSDNFILPSIIAWPLLKLGLSLPLVFNLIILGAGVLNGFFTYLLCQRLTGKMWPALIAGMSFATYPFLTSHLGHPQLQFFFFVPLSLLLLFVWISKPRFSAAFLLGFSIFLSFLCAVYYAIFTALALAIAVWALWILRPTQFKFLDYARLTLGTLIGLSPILPFLGPYLEIKETFGDRGIYEAYYFAASGLSYLSSTSLNLLYSKTASWTHAEAQLFPGVAILLLSLPAFGRMWSSRPLKKLFVIFGFSILSAGILSSPGLATPSTRIVAAVLLWLSLLSAALLTFRMGILERKLGFSILTNRGLTAIFSWLVIGFLIISLGPLGNPEKEQLALAPYRVFYALVPGFDAIRAIGRAGVLSIFALHVLAAFTLAHLGDKKRVATPLYAAVLALCLLENFSKSYPLEPIKPASTVFEYLKNEVQDKSDALTILPWTDEISGDGTVKSWGTFARFQTNYMNWALETKLPLVNGYSGQRSKLMRELPAQLLNFPDLRSITALKQIVGLRYIVYVSQNDPGFNKEVFSHKLTQMAGAVRLIMSDDSGNFLLELIAEQRLKSENTLLAPAYPTGKLYIELMGQYTKNGSDVSVEVLAPDYSEMPLATATVKPTGLWETFMVPLPAMSNKARPLRILLRPLGDPQVYLKSTRFEPNSN